MISKKIISLSMAFILFQILFLIEKVESTSNKRLISIPFSIPSPDLQSIVDSKTFFQNYFSQKLVVDFTLGEKNPYNINGIIDQDEACLEFIEDNGNNFKKYSPKDSSSFNIRTEKIYKSYQPDEYMVLGSDFFSFDINEKYNISFRFFQTKNESDIDYNKIKNKKYIVKLGLDLLSRDIYYDVRCPQFFYDTKKIANLSKYLLSFEFTENNKGNIIYGNELYIYNKKKYHESQYIGAYASVNHQVWFNRIYLDNDKYNITNGTNGIFDYNCGIILAPRKFHDNINKLFYDYMKNGICQEDNLIYNETHNYSIYSCDGKNFENKAKNFPNIIFASKGFEYNFELDYNDLFKKIGDKYYFIIVIVEKKNELMDNTWILGQPFYKKFQFTSNLDANWVGFYNPNKPIIEEPEESESEGLSTTAKTMIIIAALCVFFIGLAIAMFFLGQKLRNDRKKRANELTDDNYDYTIGINS